MAIFLKNNETSDLCATAFWLEVKGKRTKQYDLPVPSASTDANDRSVDLGAVNGVYHLYRQRSENNELHWSEGQGVAVRDGSEAPQDSQTAYFVKYKTVEVVGLEHDGVSITKNGSVNVLESFD